MTETREETARRMDKAQFRKARSLIASECCNYDGGNCICLDDGEECICAQSVTKS